MWRKGASESAPARPFPAEFCSKPPSRPPKTLWKVVFYEKSLPLPPLFANYSNRVMSKIFESIKQRVAEAEAEVSKFYDGNNAAGARVRKAMQDLKNLATELRKDVLDTKNSRKTSK
jgi:hypothetical protein